MAKTTKKLSSNDQFLESLRSLLKEELRPIQENIDNLDDHLSTKLRLTDQSLRTSMALLENKTDGIDKKIDAIARILNEHHLRTADKVEKLEEIHPNFSHQPVVA